MCIPVLSGEKDRMRFGLCSKTSPGEEVSRSFSFDEIDGASLCKECGILSTEYPTKPACVNRART